MSLEHHMCRCPNLGSVTMLVYPAAADPPSWVPRVPGSNPGAPSILSYNFFDTD